MPEYGERQFELTVKPRTGNRAADDAVLVREIVRGCSNANDARAILAPVLAPDGIGNDTHIHFSLRDTDDRPVMHDPRATLGISAVAQPFVAGILEHMPMLAALTAPSVASYFRLRPNKWAPTRANIGERDRDAALRVCPVFTQAALDAPHRFNLEYRIADATASPFLALGAIVYAGLDGLRRSLALPEHPDAERASAGIAQLPETLAAALDLLEASGAARTWLGDELFAAYLMLKRLEIAAVSGLSDEQICRRYAEVY